MGYNNYNRERAFEVNEEKTAEYLKNAVEKVTNEEDIDVLTDLLKLFRKNVPLTRRKYVTAYLLKEALKHYHFNPNASRNNRNDRYDKNNKADKTNRIEKSDKTDRSNRSESRLDANNSRNKIDRNDKTDKSAGAAAGEEEKVRRPRVEIPETEATSIFISIGKNRRVYPRDLVGLLVAVAGLDRDRIGDIKVLANYSFVQLYTSDSQTAIDKLNGYDYRGRKLAVSFSKQKSDNADETTDEDTLSEDSVIGADVDSGYEAPVSAMGMTEDEMSAEDAAALAAAEKAAADKEPFGNI